MVTTVGRILASEALPEGLYKQDTALDKGEVSRLFLQLAKEKPDQYIDALQRMNDIGRRVATRYGRTASLKLADFRTPESMRKLRTTIKDELHAIQNRDDLSSDQKSKLIVKELGSKYSNVSEKLFESLPEDSSLSSQVRAGSRGNKTQLQQMIFGDMFMVDPTNRTIPVPGLTGYAEGVTPMEYWLSAHSGRKGLVDVQLATADAGYYGKTMTNVAHRVVATIPDCGVGPQQGLLVEGGDDENVGALLARDIAGFKANTPITRGMLPKLAGKKILLRSALTCKAPEGICQHCAGLREKGEFPEIGEAVGVNAARSFAEPVTQAKLKAKHVGGVAEGGKHRLDTYEQIKQFGQVPTEFVGGAVLSGVDGRVGRVMDAPQGGTYVTVGPEQYHIPNGIEVAVKPGDTIEAGDILSAGVPNPAEIVQYKGLGEGRRYYLDKFSELLKKDKAASHRRNIEAFARAFVSRVRITDPEGYDGNLINDIVDYDTLASRWEPREGSSLKKTTSAHNLYLEQPYLHYTIGTRLTPKVTKALRENGIDEVVTHPSAPPFEPVVMRATDFTQHDKDWAVRLGGENLKRATLAAAQRGSSSERKSTSYFPTLVNITEN